MRALDLFPPTLAAAKARLAAVRPGDYARSRNAIEGAVTRLSPYISHGLLSLPELLAELAARHGLEDLQHKFVYELGWREFFHHGWAWRGDAIFSDLHEGPLPEAAYARALPDDIRQARTGLPVIDQAVRALYAEGYLHNHARMWLASYIVHLRKIHWRAGADWMYGHLLDGDLASNTLSWQWVAGTGSHKPYLFNAGNVARYAPASWHSPGSVIDQSYEALDVIARSSAAVPTQARGEGVEEPTLQSRPTTPVAAAPELAGRDVCLVHPWSLGDPPQDLAPDVLRLGLLPTEFHAARPWSVARWDFVTQRMAQLSEAVLHTDAAGLAQALQGARSVQTQADPHLQDLLAGLAGRLQCRPVPRLFPAVERPCASFSLWWRQATREK